MEDPPVSAPASTPGLDRRSFTVNEFLTIHPIGRTKFYAEVKAGRIKVVKVGKKTLIPATEPAAWLARLAGEDA